MPETLCSTDHNSTILSRPEHPQIPPDESGSATAHEFKDQMFSNSGARCLLDAGPETARGCRSPRNVRYGAGPLRVAARFAGPAPSPARDPAGPNHLQADGGKGTPALDRSERRRVPGQRNRMCRATRCSVALHCAKGMNEPHGHACPSAPLVAPRRSANGSGRREKPFCRGDVKTNISQGSEKISQPVPQPLYERKRKWRNFLRVLSSPGSTSRRLGLPTQGRLLPFERSGR